MHLKHKSDAFRIFRAAKVSTHGLIALWNNEVAFRQEIYACILLTPIIIFIHVSLLNKLILILLMLLLLVIEALNSAIELCIDRFSTEIHPISKQAKDMGSAAVGIVIIMNVIAWIYTVYQLFF
jgi:diacylglycerol kinase (ATP)